MNEFKAIIKKEWTIEFRNRTSILSVAFYLVAIIYISYIAFSANVTLEIWNSILWIALLLSHLLAIGRSFQNETDQSLYYYHLIKPSSLLGAKLIFSIGFSSILVAALLGLLVVLFPLLPDLSSLFYLNLSIGAISIASTFTLISAISSNASNQGMLMAVLGFPLSIPILIVAVSNSRKILLGAIFDDVRGGIVTLVSLLVIIIALLFILFPYSWKK